VLSKITGDNAPCREKNCEPINEKKKGMKKDSK
jgi:hypothetical protein